MKSHYSNVKCGERGGCHGYLIRHGAEPSAVEKTTPLLTAVITANPEQPAHTHEHSKRVSDGIYQTNNGAISEYCILLKGIVINLIMCCIRSLWAKRDTLTKDPAVLVRFCFISLQ